jgi:3-mercaptopyruvate sulfurtransferase SseA
VRDATIVVLAAAAIGVVSNMVRHKEKLSWIQATPYDLLVPCAEPVGQAQIIQASSPLVLDRTSLVIDARATSDYAAWHIERAISVPFDWLGPPVQDDVTRVTQMITRSNAKRVIVYGDGDNPDSGREWARLLSGGGIRNVSFIDGGAPAFRQLFKELHGEKQQ